MVNSKKIDDLVSTLGFFSLLFLVLATFGEMRLWPHSDIDVKEFVEVDFSSAHIDVLSKLDEDYKNTHPQSIPYNGLEPDVMYQNENKDSQIYIFNIKQAFDMQAVYVMKGYTIASKYLYSSQKSNFIR